jgi:hypothetical protein
MTKNEKTIPMQRVRSLVLITPIIQGFVSKAPGALRYADRLKAVLQGLSARKKAGDPVALDLLESVHFGQWSIIDGGQRLLFVAMYVGELEPYLKDFSVRVAWGVDLVWMHCEDYPGAARFEKFVMWVRRHMAQGDCFYAANPDVTVSDIKWWKGFHRQFEEFRRDVHCGADLGPRFAELERGLVGLSAGDVKEGERPLVEQLAESVRLSMKELEGKELFTQDELGPIKADFNRVMSDLRGEKAQ